MKGFIIYPTYDVKDEKAFVYLFGKLENGESFLTINEFKPYFYIKKDDAKKAEKIIEKHKLICEIKESDFRDFDENTVVKLITNIPANVPKIRELLENEKIQCYEADIRFPYRFMMDYDLLGSMEIKGEFKKGEFVSRLYENPELKPGDYFPELKTLAIDIETDIKARTIYCVSLYTDGFKKVIIVSDKKLENCISVKNEEELIQKFAELVKETDPDIITGWNMIDFDLKILHEKFRKYKIPFKLGRIDWECSIKIFNDFMRDSSADFPGRAVLDGIQLLRTSFIRLDDYSLGNAAETFLNEKKIIGIENKGTEIENLFKHNPQKLADYNLKDSEFVYRILEKTGAIDLTIQRSLATGMPLERVKASVASFDSLYLRELKKKKIVAFMGKFNEKEEGIKGGFVRDSIPGIYDNVVVVDFKSLYPSIIKTFNIDPLSFVRDKSKIPKKDLEDIKKYVKSPNNAYFESKDGILPKVIHILWEKRDVAKKKKNAIASQALKILMNSFFGVLANPSCRFFNMDMANAITHFGQFINKLTTQKIEELGYRVIYSDTDSAFVETHAKNKEEAEKIGIKIQNYINDFYEGYVKKNYARKSYLELQFDKVYLRFLMPKIRGSELGAKKRYAGLLIKEGKETIEVVGLEAIRGDWTELAQKFQMELLDRIFKKEEFISYIKKYAEDLKKGKYNDLLVYRKKITKDLKEYVKTTPPHVKAARKLKKLTSRIITYVMTTEGPEPTQQIRHKLDYEHYIEKQIKPIADSILVFQNKTFEDIIKGSSQRSLEGF